MAKKITSVSKSGRTVTEKEDLKGGGKGTSITKRKKNTKRGVVTKSKTVKQFKGSDLDYVTKTKRKDGEVVKSSSKYVGKKSGARQADAIDRKAARNRRSRMPKNPAMGRDIPLPKSK